MSNQVPENGAGAGAGAATVCITEAELAAFRSLEEKMARMTCRQAEAQRRYYETHVDDIRVKSRERRKANYQKIKNDPQRLQDVRRKEALVFARQRLQKQGYLTHRSHPDIIAALQLRWDESRQQWVPPVETPPAPAV